MKATDAYRKINNSPIKGIVLYYTEQLLKMDKVDLGSVIAQIQTGKTPPKANPKYYSSSDVNWFKPSDIGYEKYLDAAGEKFSNIAVTEKKATIYPKDTLLLIGIGGGVGRVSILKEEGSSNQQITGITFDEKVCPQYAYYYYLVREDYIKSQAKSMSFPILNQSKIKELEFRYPSVPEQNEFVKFIDACWYSFLNNEIPNISNLEISLELKEYALKQFKAIELDDKIQKNIENELTLLSKLKQSILQEAIQGKLTADWREDNSPPPEGCLKGGVVNTSHKDEMVNYRNSKNYFSLPFNPALKQRAKELRKAGNLSEVLFWNEVKRKQFKGIDFDRQKIIGNYIVDFYCPNFQVVIEIDGSSHDDKQEYDTKRDAYLQDLGLTVIHISDINIKKKLAETMNWLYEHPAFEPSRDVGTKEPPRPADTPPVEGNWEPASELLKRIKAEKAQLIKDKKIKKEKPLPPITAEEIPFELPDGWVWCRLGEICRKITDGFHNTPPKVENGYPYIAATHVKSDKIDWANAHKVSEKFHKELFYKTNPEKGEILVVNIGAGSGCPAIIDVDFEFSFKNTAILKFNQDLISNKYLFYFLISIQEENYKMLTRGANQPFLSLKVINRFLIPFPPLEEQKAIVEKVASLMKKCQALEQEIKSSEANAQMLMQAVLKEAFLPA